VADWNDVRRIALALPESEETTMRGQMAWKVRGKLFVWERPLRTGDLAALGDAAPEGPILGARVEHELAKRLLIEEDPEVYFTIPHFDGYAAILIRLPRIGLPALEEAVTEAWLLRAPKRVAAAWLADRPAA
jgi:hypothetical protein